MQASLDLPASDVVVTLILGSMTTASSLRVMQPPLHTHVTQWSTHRSVTGRLIEGTQPQHVPYPRDSHTLTPSTSPLTRKSKGQSSHGHSGDARQQVEGQQGPLACGEALLAIFHASGGCCATLPCLAAQRGTVSGSRSHSSSVEDRAQAPGQDPQGSVLPSMSLPLRQQGKRMRLGALS